jgi:hypothetical protein
MSTVQETVVVSCPGNDVVVIEHHRTFDNGHVMDETLVIARAAAGWLADKVVELFSPGGDASHELDAAPDALSVSFGGSDQEPCANVINRRDRAAARGGPGALGGVLEPMAHELAAKLRAL